MEDRSCCIGRQHLARTPLPEDLTSSLSSTAAGPLSPAYTSYLAGEAFSVKMPALCSTHGSGLRNLAIHCNAECNLLSFPFLSEQQERFGLHQGLQGSSSPREQCQMRAKWAHAAHILAMPIASSSYGGLFIEACSGAVKTQHGKFRMGM